MELYKIAESILSIYNKKYIDKVGYGTFFKDGTPEEVYNFWHAETQKQFYERYKTETGIDMFEIDKLQKPGIEHISITLPGESNNSAEKIKIEIPIDCDQNTEDEAYMKYLEFLDKYETHITENNYESIEDSIDKVFIEKFGYSIKTILYDQAYHFDVESTLVPELLLVGRRHDAYGSGCYRLKPRGKKFHLFSDYDNGSDTKNLNVVTSLMIVDDETRDMFLADIEYQKENNKFVFVDMQCGEFPEPLWKFGIREFCGKRSFYWWISKKTVNLRCDEDILKQLDKEYQGAKFFKKNLSGGRVKIKLKSFNPK